MQKMFAPLAAAALMFAASADARADSNNNDFGLFRERLLNDRAEQLFGVHAPLAASSTESISAAEANRDPTALVTLAGGLRAHVVSAATNLGPNVDMMALWPDDSSPTHLIFCNEENAAQPGKDDLRSVVHHRRFRFLRGRPVLRHHLVGHAAEEDRVDRLLHLENVPAEVLVGDEPVDLPVRSFHEAVERHHHLPEERSHRVIPRVGFQYRYPLLRNGTPSSPQISATTSGVKK